MKLMHRPLVGSSILFLSMLIIPFSHAALVQGTMQGVIAEYADTQGEGDSVFGLDGAGLLGQAFIVNFSYQTELAPLVSSSSGYDSLGVARNVYQSNDPALDWLSLSITVNNRTHTIEGDYRRADIMDALSTDPYNINNPYQTDHFHLAVDGYSSDESSYYRRQYLDIAAEVANDTLENVNLPTSFFSDEITRVYNSGAFSIHEFDVDPVTDAMTYERYVGFNLDVQSIQASVVPVPGAVWLFGSGLMGLIAFARRRKQI